ncbi:hypothetical protein PC128_g17054 [Phytophthora cactorum]|nr:hypothetical protein PC128_g17054 [Phytophthora cactorum]
MRVSGLLAILAATSTMAQDHTITFRSLKEEDSASSSLPSDSSFAFDGTNSDIAQQLYIRHQAGDTSAAVAINSIPTAVTDRLDPLKITFADLPGLVQRAILWDSGFGISPEGDPVQIWTIGDYTMADIAVPQDDITQVNCTMLQCPQPNDVPAYSSQYCSGTQILNVSRCVVDTFDDSGATNFLGTMWSTGGDCSMTPHIRLRDHTWTEPTTGISYSVYAVHTVSSADDPTWNQCPANDGYLSLIVPCHKRSEFTDAEMAAMTKPTGTAWVTTWLKDEFAVEDSGFEELLLIPIILVVIAAMGIGWFCWKRSTMLKREQSSSCDFDVVSPNYLDVAAHQQALRHTVTTTSHGPSISSHPDDYESAGSNQTFKILLHSQHLHGNRIPYENLLFQTELSKGASGEVWICRYGGQQVAVKKLLHTKDQKAEDVQVFAEEIELTASMLHPHIVKFIGVAWNSLSNLSMRHQSPSIPRFDSRPVGMAGHDTISLRSLASVSSSSSSSFEFDGTTSDIAQQLFIRHQAGDAGQRVNLTRIPAAVSDRLDPLNIKFKELPGLVQRAVLWDTGFAISPGNNPVQIWTMQNYTMADIAVPKADVSYVDCTYLNCSQPNGVTAHYAQYCTGWQMLNVSRCVADNFEDPGASGYMGMMWSTGGEPDMIPLIRLREHTWGQDIPQFGGRITFHVSVVHTVPNELDPAWDKCPLDKGYASLTVPCHRRIEFTDEYMAANTTIPTERSG